MIYLDNAATTRVHPEVREAMLPYFCEHYGNSETLYQAGVTARTACEKARQSLAALLGATPEEIYFTSGATESNNWVLQSVLLNGNKKHVITTAIEHHAVLEPVHHLQKQFGVEATILPVDGQGLVDPEALRQAIRPDTALVSIMHGNNEIGTVQPLAELAALAREKGVPFHTDACQTVGKLELDVHRLGVDMLSLSAHKFHGPKGIGALYLRKGARLQPLLRGGFQENRRRAGTSNVPGIVGLGQAAEIARASLKTDGEKESRLVEKLWTALAGSIAQIRRNGHPEKRLPNILNICIAGGEGEAYLMYLDMMFGIQASSGSACTTGSLDPSHVLLAIGLPAEEAHGSLRFSLSGETSDGDIEQVISALPEVVKRVRAMSPTWQG